MERAERSRTLQIQAHQRAERSMPGGTVGLIRLPPEVAPVVARGQGTRLWDLDGNEYTDFVLGSGPLILGHAHPAVVQTVREQLEKGTHYFALHEPAIRLAEEIIKAIPCAEMLRYASTGTEATSHCLRLARAFTGREKILRFEGGYNGHHDYALISSAPPVASDYPRGIPDSAGIPRRVLDEVLVAPFNDAEATVAIIEQNARDLAAVIIEPFQRVIKPRPGFLETLRTITRELGIMLIFDEVVTAFRLAYGGAQEYYGVVPDLAALAKTIGGGFPLGAVVGRADIMGLCDGRRRGSPEWAFLGGTLVGNPISCVAGLATLAELRKPGTYERLSALGERMRSRLAAIVAEEGIPAQSLGEGSVFRLVFVDRPVESYTDMLRADLQLGVQLNTELLRHGFYVTPDKGYISLIHTDEEIDRYVTAVGQILHEMKKNGKVAARK